MLPKYQLLNKIFSYIYTVLSSELDNEMRLPVWLNVIVKQQIKVQ